MPIRSPARRTKRKQGRPQKDMPAVGRETLIAATRKLMKVMPPGQITRLDIARAAGVDPALIRYYFGDKSKLIVAAVLDAGAELRDRQRANFAKGGSPSERLTRRIGVLMSSREDDAEAQARVALFRQGLSELGWTEGRNINVDYRWVRGRRGPGEEQRCRTRQSKA